MFQFRQLVFWFLVWGIQWVFLLHVVMPSVEKIDLNVSFHSICELHLLISFDTLRSVRALVRNLKQPTQQLRCAFCLFYHFVLPPLFCLFSLTILSSSLL